MKTADERLHALTRDLDGVEFSSGHMAQLRQRIRQINAYVVQWGYS
ncbi:hypothetical protein GCM10025857_15900 [Alicyclobacillus contaminans]|nr:hypothetical protein [Alicyclobacillus contaminans]GMA50233.1 hypothetical protein GCM10025857_15900 [Alicyclobacillus contaminans]